MCARIDGSSCILILHPKKLTPGRPTRIFIAEFHANLVDSPFPVGAFLSRNTSFPDPAAAGLAVIVDRARKKVNRMVSSPLFALLAQASLSDTRRHCTTGKKVRVREWRRWLRVANKCSSSDSSSNLQPQP